MVSTSTCASTQSSGATAGEESAAAAIGLGDGSGVPGPGAGVAPGPGPETEFRRVYRCDAFGNTIHCREVTITLTEPDTFFYPHLATPAGAIVQQAFVEADAYQCGFCTAGQIMSMRALLPKMGLDIAATSACMLRSLANTEFGNVQDPGVRPRRQT